MKIKTLVSVLSFSACFASSAHAYSYTGDQHFTFWSDGGSASPVGDPLRKWSSISTRNLSTYPLYLTGPTYGYSVFWYTDGVFLGLQQVGPERKDAILAWGDDPDDNLRIVFNGVDVMRFTSVSTHAINPFTIEALPGLQPVALEIKASSDTVSNRAAVKTGVWLMGQDWSADGAENWFVGNGTGSTPKLLVQSDGKVGIGTATPSHALSVNGGIRAKEIIVDTNWADDVFAPNYRLASLTEVEQHIKAKGHLPAMPSAVEVAEKGISVGESQAMLLRKIEELTLHVIALNKQVQSQQKRLMELESPQGEAQNAISAR